MNGLLGNNIDDLLIQYRLGRLPKPSFGLPGMSREEAEQFGSGLLGVTASPQGRAFIKSLPEKEIREIDIPKLRDKMIRHLSSGGKTSDAQFQIYMDQYMNAVDTVEMNRPRGR